MPQTTPSLRLSAGASNAVRTEEDIVKLIQDWHVTLRTEIFGFIAGDSLVTQSSNNTNDRGTGSRPSFTSLSQLVSCDGISPHLSEHSIYSRPVKAQILDDTDFVQSTWSFIFSDLYRRLEQSRQQISWQRTVMKKHHAYLVQCRLAAEREKKAAQDLLSNAISSLQAAEREREKFATERVAALQDLCLNIRRRQTFAVEGPCLTTSFISSSGLSESSVICPPDLLLVPANHKYHLLTPPRTPFGKDAECESEPTVDGLTTSDAPNGPGCITTEQNQDCSIIDGHLPFQSAKGNTLQNPIGPYIRPPMSLEDMQKCIRCLLGKDKSLKTGNRARAFLGVPWSVIVSWDPDVLLQRGICGIKLGSTGMASRLRMMTIIESALANQGNDAIPEEVWERPTYFCERCQERYPITVRSDETVPTDREYETRLQPSAINDILYKRDLNVKSKRNRKQRHCSNA